MSKLCISSPEKLRQKKSFTRLKREVCTVLMSSVVVDFSLEELGKRHTGMFPLGMGTAALLALVTSTIPNPTTKPEELQDSGNIPAGTPGNTQPTGLGLCRV